MISLAHRQINSNQRTLFSKHIKHGMILEALKNCHGALEIYLMVEQKLDIFVEKYDIIFSEEVSEESFSWKCLKHQLYFCIGSVYLELEQKESSDKYYSEAETYRKGLLDAREQDVKEIVNSTQSSSTRSEIAEKLREAFSIIYSLTNVGISLSFGIHSYLLKFSGF